MKTIYKKIELYKFHELEKSIQDDVINNYRNVDYFHSGDEYINSLKVFASYTGITISDYSLGNHSHSYIKWSLDTDFELNEMEGLRLTTWLINNWLPLFSSNKITYFKQSKRTSKIKKTYDLELTGCYTDHELTQGIYNQINKPDLDLDLEQLIDNSFDAFIEDYKNDLEYWHSDECITEEIENNNYDFLIDGVRA